MIEGPSLRWTLSIIFYQTACCAAVKTKNTWSHAVSLFIGGLWPLTKATPFEVVTCVTGYKAKGLPKLLDLVRW
jgi:hypothetical protein